jgi:hypothetical protein
MKVLLEFSFDDRQELESFLKEQGGGTLYGWAFAEICQNLGFGFLSDIRFEEEDD